MVIERPYIKKVKQTVLEQNIQYMPLAYLCPCMHICHMYARAHTYTHTCMCAHTHTHKVNIGILLIARVVNHE